MTEHSRRSPARYLAPVALIGAVFALFVVVTGSSVEDSGGNRDEPAATSERERPDTPATETETTETTTRRPGPRTYAVKAGDTLGAISEQTGVPLERLQELNPDLDPQAMVAGQRIKLRE